MNYSIVLGIFGSAVLLTTVSPSLCWISHVIFFFVYHRRLFSTKHENETAEMKAQNVGATKWSNMNEWLCIKFNEPNMFSMMRITDCNRINRFIAQQSLIIYSLKDSTSFLLSWILGAKKDKSYIAVTFACKFYTGKEGRTENGIWTSRCVLPGLDVWTKTYIQNAAENSCLFRLSDVERFCIILLEIS